MQTETRRSVQNIDLETYRKDGVVCVRGLFSEWVEPLREAVASIMADPSPLSNNHAGEGKGTFFTDIYMWRRSETFRRFLVESPISELAASIMNASEVRLYNEHLLVKEPGSQAPTPWHQDQTYFVYSGEKSCSIWIALDDVTEENGAMSFVRGSHTWDRVFGARTFRDGRAITDDDREPVPDIDGEPEKYDLVTYDLSPGDCTVHHGLTLHGAPPNRSKTTRRRGLSYRFVGEDARFRRMAFNAPLPGPVDLADGAPLAHHFFPRLWPATENLAELAKR